MNEKNTHTVDAFLHAVAPVPLPEVRKLIIDAKHELISEFVKHIDKIIGECQNYQQYFEELIMMKEFYEEKLK